MQIGRKLLVPGVASVGVALAIGALSLWQARSIDQITAANLKSSTLSARVNEISAQARLYLAGEDTLKATQDSAAALSQWGTAEQIAPVTQAVASLAEAEKRFVENASIESEVYKLTETAIRQSDGYIVETATKLANPATERQVSMLERQVIIAANTNTTGNYSARVLFLQMKDDISLKDQMMAFLDKALAAAASAETMLAGTPFVELPRNAAAANTRMKELVQKYAENAQYINQASRDVAARLEKVTTDIAASTQGSLRGSFATIKLLFLGFVAAFLAATILSMVVSTLLSRGIAGSVGLPRPSRRESPKAISR